MIKKLKFKFIFLTMISLLILLLVLISGINLMSYNSVVADSDEILEVLSHNRGAFPEHKDNKFHKDKKPMSPEAPYESRFFTVLMDNSGNIIQTNTSRIKSVDTKKAIEFSNDVYTKNRASGFIDVYRFSKTDENGNIRITFLDCRKQLDSFYSFLEWSIIVSAIGYIVVFLIIFFCSGRIIKPIAESYEKQKRFITYASHEIKTPLTIINANADILEAEKGENEYVDDIRAQTRRLTELTADLIYLTKMEENDKLDLIDVPFSDIVTETIESFTSLIKQANISLIVEIEPLLTVQGNTKSLNQLVNSLLDNAVKYTPQKGNIIVKLNKRGKNAELSIENSTRDTIKKDNLNKVFDRFYRTDVSRNSETGGHGIGLSIAKAIVEKHSGKIFASSNDAHNFKITTNIPLC